MADGRCDGLGYSSPHALNFVYAPGIGVVRATSSITGEATSVNGPEWATGGGLGLATISQCLVAVFAREYGEPVVATIY